MKKQTFLKRLQIILNISSFFLQRCLFVGLTRTLRSVLGNQAQITFFSFLGRTAKVIYTIYILLQRVGKHTNILMDVLGMIYLILSFSRVEIILQIKKGELKEKKLIFMHTKRFNTFLKRWVQFLVGAIPRLPFNYIIKL